jgi:hypothetical protein
MFMALVGDLSVGVGTDTLEIVAGDDLYNEGIVFVFWVG